MSNIENIENDTAHKAGAEGARKLPISGGQDLPDTPEDMEKMKPETIIMDLPEVSDIPGQENVVPAPFGELGDTTASSDDEEGVGILDFEDEDESDDIDKDLVMGTEGDVSGEEKLVLQQADEDMPTDDDQRLRAAGLDNEDEDGEPLNEEGFGVDVSGNDLDIPGTEADDANESIGEEDEENNHYSRGGAENDNMTEGTP